MPEHDLASTSPFWFLILPSVQPRRYLGVLKTLDTNRTTRAMFDGLLSAYETTGSVPLLCPHIAALRPRSATPLRFLSFPHVPT